MRSTSGAVLLLAGMLAMLPVGCQSIQQHRATVHAQQGIMALDAGKLDQARWEFQQAANNDPKFAFAYRKMGDIQTMQGEHAAAADSYNAALKASPYDTDIALRLGQAYRYVGRLAEAARAFLYACDIEPTSFKANFELANCYLQMGQPQKAQEYYNRAIEIDPNSAEAFQNLAVAQEAGGDLDVAIRSYLQSIEQNPIETNILLNLAACHLRQGKPHLAQQALQRALLINDTNPTIHRQLAYCLFLQKKYEPAEMHYRRAIELGKDPQAHAGIGVVMMMRYLAQQEPRDMSLRNRAIQHWQRSLELEPNQPKLIALVAKYAQVSINDKAVSQTVP